MRPSEKDVHEEQRRFDGTFFDSEKKVVDLRRHTVSIEIEKDSLVALRRFVLHPAFVAMLVMVALVGSLLFYKAPSARAEISFYPHSCLGAWNGTTHAEGTPEVSNTKDSASFTPANSAVLPSDTAGAIFCGGFSGEIPVDTAPRSLVITFSLAAIDSPPPASAAEATSTDNFILPPSILSALESTTTVDTTGTTTSHSAVPPDTAPAPAPASEVTPHDVPAAPSDVPASGASSSLWKLIPTAFAADESVTATSDPVTPSTSTEAQSTSSSNVSAAAIEALPTSDPLVEVSYTLDGTVWASLGTMDRDQFSSASFSIPISPDASWGDLSKLQISIQSLTVPDKPALYLDGIKLSVSYGAATQSDKALPPNTLKAGAVFPDNEKQSFKVVPQRSNSSIIFYENIGGTLNYVAETAAHGPAPLSEYYSPLPDAGSYVMVEYDNGGGQFDCFSITSEACISSSHFIARTDFKITKDDSASKKATTSAAQ